jgi:hypothetical protein
VTDPQDQLQQRDLPPRLTALIGALSFVTLLLAIALAPAWMAGAAIAFVIGVTALHRWVWRWWPRTWAACTLVAVTAGGALIGHALASGGPNRKTEHVAAAPAAKPPGTTKQQAPSEPPLNPDATCASLQGASYNGDDKLHTIYAGSPGQLSAGPGTLEGRVLPPGKYTQVIRTKSGDKIQLSVQLSNTGYGSVTGVSLAAVMNPYGTNCWRLWVTTHSATHQGGNVKLGPAFVVWPTKRSSRLVYVPHSTVLYDEHGKVLARLPDGVVGKGTPLPYAIPATTYFVNFLVRVT